MAWSYANWLFAAGIACWCGLLSILHARVLRAGASATSLKRSVADSQRRLTSCEELLNELVQAISRIEARDRMRRVRAGLPSQEPATNAADPSTLPGNSASPGSSGKLSDLPTAEIRRRLAMRIPLSEAKR